MGSDPERYRLGFVKKWGFKVLAGIKRLGKGTCSVFSLRRKNVSVDDLALALEANRSFRQPSVLCEVG